MGTNKYLLNGKNGRLEIKNNYGKFEVLFDLQDYEIIKNYTWRILPDKKFNTYYAISGSHKKQILMHRLITNCPANKVIDHKNHNGLDKELLSYIRKLEQALDEIKKIILKATTVEETGKDLGYSDKIPYDDLLEIIQKAKGDVKNENNNV